MKEAKNHSSEFPQKRMPLRQCNAVKKVNKKEIVKKNEKISPNSKNLVNAGSEACSKKLTCLSKVNKENISSVKKQSLKENLPEKPVEKKKTLCYKFLSATPKDKLNCNDDVYDIYLDKDMEDKNLTKKVKKRSIKNKGPQAKKYKKIPVFNLRKLEDVHPSKNANICISKKDRFETTQKQSISNRQASTLNSKLQSAILSNRQGETLSTNQIKVSSMDLSRESCVENILQNISSKAPTSDIGDNFNSIADMPIIDEENVKHNSKDHELCQALSVSHNLTLLSNASSLGNTDSQRKAEGSLESVDFYSEFELSFSALEMMHSTPEKVRPIPNSVLSLRIENSPIPKSISNEQEITGKTFKANCKAKDKVAGKENHKTIKSQASKTSLTKNVSRLQRNSQKNKQLHPDHFEVPDNNAPQCSDITLYESPVKASPVEKTHQSKKNCYETDMLIEKEVISFEGAEENPKYPSFNLFEEFDSPKPIQKDSSPPEIKELVVKPKKGYQTPELFRKHLLKNKKYGAAAQKKKTETKLDKWAIKLNSHFDEIEQLDLCVE